MGVSQVFSSSNVTSELLVLIPRFTIATDWATRSWFLDDEPTGFLLLDFAF